jgi:hypothetical protein
MNIALDDMAMRVPTLEKVRIWELEHHNHLKTLYLDKTPQGVETHWTFVKQGLWAIFEQDYTAADTEHHEWTSSRLVKLVQEKATLLESRGRALLPYQTVRDRVVFGRNPRNTPTHLVRLTRA